MDMHRVAVLAVNWVGSLDLAVPGQVFGTAHSLDKAPGELFGEPLYDVFVCGERGELTVMGVGGVELYRMTAPHTLDEARTADTIIVPCARTADPPSPAVLDVLRDAHARGVRIASICTGSFALAAAGLLDGKTATTHWTMIDLFRERYPQVDVDPGVLFVDNGDVLTAAGAATGLDLAVHMVRNDFGAAVAADVSQHMVISPQRDPGQTQFNAHPAPGESHASLEPTMRWIREHMQETFTLADIAAHASVSPRTLNRRFRDQTGTTPVRWLLMQRIRRARELLETTDLSIEEVALQCGFGNAINLRKHFAHQVQTSPHGYRTAFRLTH